jgi:hypothetical protein
VRSSAFMIVRGAVARLTLDVGTLPVVTAEPFGPAIFAAYNGRLQQTRRFSAEVPAP